MATVADVTERLRGALKGQKGLDRTVKIDLKGEGVIFLDGADVSNEDAPADCTVIVALADLVALARGQLDPAMAMMRGRLKITGDASVALKLQPILAGAGVMAEPAPRLIDTPQAPVPSGGSAEIFYGKDGVPLRAAYWRPEGPPRGSVVLSPGRTEPIEKYFEVVGELLRRGFAVLVHDWRGQGLSHRLLPDRMRGHAADFSHFVDDHQALLAAFADRLPRPCIALAHSMGGCLVALALPQEPRIDAAVFTSPMFGVHLGPLPRWLSYGLTETFVRFGAQGAVVPRGGYDPVTADFQTGNIWTHDRGRFERHRAQLQACPELALGGVTWGWLDAAFKGMDRALAADLGAAITVPVLIVLAGDERLVVNAASRRFARNTPHAQVIEVTGASHEILMETDAIRVVFWQEFDRFVRALDESR